MRWQIPSKSLEYSGFDVTSENMSFGMRNSRVYSPEKGVFLDLVG
jgi:hypothetical protein